MAQARKTFTGKHMAAVFVAGFGIVIAVNLTMATMAVGSFHGTVVDNSYVASQNYNGWLKQAAASRALGWQAVPHLRADGRVVVEALGVPAGARMSGTAEHPLGTRADVALTFADQGGGRWVSNETIDQGRWQVRLAIRAGEQSWAGEAEIR